MRKSSYFVLIGLVLLSTSFTKSFGQSDQDQRIHTSYVLSFGRDATDAEVKYWKGRGNYTISQLLDYHRQGIPSNAGLHRTLITRAYIDAMGRNPLETEIKYWLSGTDNYTQLMKNHLQWLSGNPAEYEKVVKRAFMFALNRQPTPDQLNQWKNNSQKYSYAMLVSYLQSKKSSSSVQCTPEENALSLGLSTPAIVRIPINANIAQEARMAASLVASGGGNIIAAGSGKLVASGGGNLVASGGGNLVASGGGN